MNVKVKLAGLLMIICVAAHAQDPQPQTQDDSFGTSPTADQWRLNLAASQFPGRKPRSGLPRQALDDGEFLVGLPFGRDAQGNSGYVFIPSGAPRARIKAGWPRVRRPQGGTRTDAYTAKFDSDDGEFAVAVKRTDSRDGASMTLKVDLTNAQGRAISYVLVFDRQ